ncbi:ABC transporter substrate-binding protein [Ruminiclostridium cellobioparum]|jgi:ABC-type glycerol-3-phosphate transport system substrate-binding protein|uniref:ABC transporter substrate-binding protein n=1 Tax=Ruminiclostridium cellobioparum TaxID=29355 RepID=UPI0028ADA765|nr:ABC transporter substrate-binding protein [Ruminiclostridium cellobioparum]
MRNRFFLVLVSAILIIGLNACSLQNDNNGEEGDGSSPELAVLSWSNSHIEGVVSQFSSLYPKIKIKDKRYFDGDEGGIIEKAITELMSGKGPDILILRAQDFPNVHKMLDNNTFYDLDKLIKNDGTFEIDQYNKIAMDSGIYEGSRYLMPLYFNIPVMFTTRSFLTNQGFGIPEGGITWDNLAQMSGKFLNNDNNKGKYLFSYDFNFENLIQGSYMNFIDYSKRKSSFDSAEFINLLNIYKELQPAVCPAEISKKANVVELLTKGTIGIMQDDKPIEVSSLLILNSCCKQYMGEDMYMIPFPGDQQKENITGNVRVLAGINANCKKPQEAFKFLTLLLSKDNQIPYVNDPLNTNYVKGCPINIEAWKEELRHHMSDEIEKMEGTAVDDAGSIKFTTSPLSPDIGTKAEQLYNGMARADINDYRVLTILSEGTADFLAGKISAEQAAKAINQKIMLYLNE